MNARLAAIGEVLRGIVVVTVCLGVLFVGYPAACGVAVRAFWWGAGQ